MKYTGIEWTDRTWNPATGCTKVSTGCKNCYAERIAKRLKKMGQKKYRNEFEYTEHENYIDDPLKWKKPSKIFVNSMSDLFHENATDEFLNKVFYVMKKADWHQFQILTKRPHLMKEYFERTERFYGGYLGIIPQNIWIGTSIENAEQLQRLQILKQIPAHMKFISFEPLLSKIGNVDLTGVDWVIVGGESGINFRDVIQEEWILELQDICKRDGVAFFFKQFGGKSLCKCHNSYGCCVLQGNVYHEIPQLKIII